MNNEEKALNMLGLAQRAFKIISGEGMVIDAIRTNKAKLVLIATDASENTREKMQNKGKYYHIPTVIALTSNQLSQSIGRMRKVVAITDDGFAKKINELLH